jgi:hypothetical protein
VLTSSTLADSYMENFSSLLFFQVASNSRSDTKAFGVLKLRDVFLLKVYN